MGELKRHIRTRLFLKYHAIEALSVLLVTSCLIYVYATDDHFSKYALTFGPVTFHFNSILVILISSIVGFVPAMVSFLMLFITSVFLDVDRAFTVFVYLIAGILSFLAVRRGLYRQEAWKLSGLVAVLALVLGGVHGILAALTSGVWVQGGVAAMDFLYHVLGELPECIIAVGLTYLFLVKCPYRIRSLTSTGRFYNGENQTDIFSQFRASRLSQTVTSLIVAEGVALGIAAACFANTLLPTIGEEVFSEAEGNFFHDIMNLNDSGGMPQEDGTWNGEDADEEESSVNQSDSENNSDNKENTENNNESNNGESIEQIPQDVQAMHRHRRFVFNQSGIAFDIKLIMLLLNTAIPFTVLANVIAQRIIVSPIILMSSSISRFCEVPQASKEEQLKEIRSLPIRSRNEIGELYHALNLMATNIVSFVDEEREKEKLAADLLVAQKTSENKSNFLSSVSHELRTPINAVLGLDEMILRECGDETIVEYATEIQNAGKTLLGLVNDILDSSKLEEGKMELIPTDYELASTINDLINMIAVKAQDKQLRLDVNVAEDTPNLLYGDEVRLKQVILNILTNAVKYTEEGSVTMNIGFEKINEEYIFLEVQVKDTGIGIKEEDQKKLFARFERIEEGRNKNIEGTGLGMSIVRQLLALMETELEVESVYGEGSNFHFRVCQRVVKWQPIGDFTEAYKRSIAGNEGYRTSFVAPEAQILVVDDTPLNLTVVKGLLKETQVKMTTAASGAETLELVKKYHYDLIFLDQRMPEMDGIETFHEMERLTAAGENQSAGVPVIALTANAISGMREEFLKEGFTDYISKPIDSQKLERMVRDYLPDEKVLEPDEVEILESVDNAYSDEIIEFEYNNDDDNENKSAHNKMDSPLKGITSIDYDTAIRNCGSEELLMSVLADYLEAVPTKLADIRRFWEAGDYQNYTILVHAMKSSSRLIGAVQLSEDAAYLEACGDRAQEGDAEAVREIEERTPALLKLYRSYYDKLTPLISNEADADLRPEIVGAQLDEALAAIREFVEAFDFDSADGVMEMLGDYRMPEDFADRFAEIRRSLSAVDRERLLDLL